MIADHSHLMAREELVTILDHNEVRLDSWSMI